MAQPKPPFVFPREYSFPPFFTRQTNLTTHHAQLEKWSALILAYTQHHRIFKLTPPSAASSSNAAAAADPSLPPTAAAAHSTHNTDDLFHNKALNRRLAPADAREVLDAMRRDGRAETVARDGDAVWVYWRTPEEWAALVEAWVDDTAQKGVVVTLYELTEGDTSIGTEFHGMDPDLLLKALQVLAKRGKAQVFGQDDSLGVKFF
ncbi:hypothetical protein BN1708_012811 [Verticillium longisporum]|uniref:ESCRT-II complex subunit VPS25 n=1 Tax=Verticillium longisporum TaxID=100787 RepID=A0A0G4LE82_VERLO|nr:hypothetical protein BN1708_012811 [Verticillium longisporum]